MSIMEIYKAMYPAGTDDVLDYATIYNAADTAAAIERAGKAASKPETPMPSLTFENMPEFMSWRPHRTPEEWAARLHDTLRHIVTKGFLANVKQAEMEAIVNMYYRGLTPVMREENDLYNEIVHNMQVNICRGCSVSLDDFQRIWEDLHG